MRRVRMVAVLALVAGAVVVPQAPAGAAPARDAAPVISPTPRHLVRGHGSLALPDTVTVVRGADTDAAAEAALTAVLTAAGVRHVRTAPVGATAPSGELTVYLGGPGENPATGAELQRLHVAGPAGLAAEGYVLATGSDRGHGVVALSGVDGAGTFYAVQTLRQVLGGHRVPVLSVRDAPAMAVRGTIEGFYGTPWSQADRLDQLDFYGAHKLNTYEYSPKDDPYLRDKWRDAYPADLLAQLEVLVDRAAANHVRFTYALSPGLSVCYSSDADLAALVAKFEQVYAIGIRSFTVPLDDISYTKWNCDADAAKFGTGAAAAGTAQAYLLNRVNTAFVAKHQDVRRLQTVATEYYDLKDSPYKQALRSDLDPDVIVMWTGVGVIAHAVTVPQAQAAKQVFGHDILLWDNYPVNDYLRGRLEMAPYLNRAPGLSGALVGDVANPMNQAAASKIALATVADYTWNDAAYDPQRSWTTAIDQFAGGDARLAAALRAFADVEYQVPDITGVQAPELSAAVGDFWTAWRRDDARGIAAFASRVAGVAAAPAVIRAGAEPAFSAETAPWLTSMQSWGQAMSAALDMLRAQRDGDGDRAAADRARIPALVAAARKPVDPIDDKTPVQVGDGVVDTFVTAALAENDRWLGVAVDRGTWTVTGGPAPVAGSTLAAVADRNPDTAYTAGSPTAAGDALTLTAGTARPLSTVLVVGTGAANVRIRSGDGPWRPLGRLSGGRYTALDAHGRTADTVQLSWSAGTTPSIAEVVPVGANDPTATLTATPATADVEASDTLALHVTVNAVGTGPVRGTVHVATPDGLTADPTSAPVSLRRGNTVTVPITLQAAAGAATGPRTVTVSLGTLRTTVAIQIYPHTTGTDVALASGGATATASSIEIGDESRFAAAFAIDGDPTTRWSSGYEDDAWLTVALPTETRLGKVVLTWEASYGKAYRIELSDDAATWTTVASITNGDGATDTLHFPATTARYIRMQGVTRALTWGYSLYTLSAYPVD